MRTDMARVVTERERRGHTNPSRKWGRRLGACEYDHDDHGPARAPIARRTQYGWKAKEFSDRLGPLRRYLRKQVGRPWDQVWSEITRTLDKRSLSGQHIFEHIQWEVEQHVRVGDDGRLYHDRWSRLPLEGLYVDPATGLLRNAPKAYAGVGRVTFWKAQAKLRKFGIQADTVADIRRYRIDGTRVWERRDRGWFVHSYRHVPQQLDHVATRGNGRRVAVYRQAHYQLVSSMQASRKDRQRARAILERDPLNRRAG
jgi:hypothetical protein